MDIHRATFNHQGSRVSYLYIRNVSSKERRGANLSNIEAACPHVDIVVTIAKESGTSSINFGDILNCIAAGADVSIDNEGAG